MRKSSLEILRAPGAQRALQLIETQEDEQEVVSGKLLCEETGRSYAIVGGGVHLFDEADCSPFLQADYEKFRRSFGVPPSAEWARAVAHYKKAKYVNTEFLFSGLSYAGDKRRVLELGAGDGGLISRFADMGWDAYAVDFFPWEIEAGYRAHRERGGAHFERVHAPLSRLPFASGTFDLIYMHATLHHSLPNRHEDFAWYSPRNMHDALWEIRRILSPDGGLFVLGEGIYPDDVADRYLERKAQEGAVYESWYTLAEYDDAFRSVGIFPAMFVYEDRLWMRAHGYSRYGRRLPIITQADGITVHNCAQLNDALAERVAPLLPEWIDVRRDTRRSAPSPAMPRLRHLPRRALRKGWRMTKEWLSAGARRDTPEWRR